MGAPYIYIYIYDISRLRVNNLTMPFLVTNLQLLRLAASVKSGIACDGLDFVLSSEIQSKTSITRISQGEICYRLKAVYIYIKPSFLFSFIVWMGV